jgi:hypothetical protein
MPAPQLAVGDEETRLCRTADAARSSERPLCEWRPRLQGLPSSDQESAELEVSSALPSKGNA